MSYGFVANFYALSSSAKILKIGLRFDKVTESLKVGRFLRHSIDEVLNSLMYGLPFCVIIYRSYKLSNVVRFLCLKLIGIFGVVSFL